jgi:LuxR family transcriptional regulator, maltose regulon positive regulatory protein
MNHLLQTSLLRTKLYPPRVRRGTVDRPRLNRLLEQGLERKLTLVSAPAGSGKTTLVAQWRSLLGERGLPLGWVSLDPSDNDPVQFWRYLATALEAVQQGSGQEVVDLLGSAHPPQPQQLLLALVNALAAVPDDFVIGLDDYHVIEAEPVHDLLALLLDHLPPQCHLLLLTRADPPLPLSRLRARQELVEVRARDLRFTDDEAKTWLTATGAPTLSAEGLSRLTERTEGWAAGLQLAMLSLQNTADPEPFLAGLMGTNRYIVDYLIEEVFQRQPAPVQQFLLSTSVLDRLTGPLCDAVTGSDGSAAVLEQLEQQNLFTAAVDDERQWFRYHHLFASMLQGRLQRTMPEAVPDLHLRASHWYEANGEPVPAIRAALVAGAMERAADLLEKVADAMTFYGEAASFLTLVEALPAPLRAARLRLNVQYAICLQSVGRMAPAKALLRELEPVVCAAKESGTPEGRDLFGRLRAMEAAFARMDGQAPAAIELAGEALANLAPADVRLRSMATVNLAACLQATGQMQAAVQALEEVVRLTTASDDRFLAVFAMCALGECLERQGALHASLERFRAAEQAIGGHGPAVAVLGWSLVGQGRMLYEQGQTDEALPLLRRGVELGARYAHVDTQLRGWLALVHLYGEQGDLAQMKQAMAALEEAFRAVDVPVVAAFVKSARARVHLAEGRADLADLVLTEEYWRFDPEAAAQVCLALGRPQQAVERLAPVAHAAIEHGQDGAAVQMLVPLAVAQAAAGDREAALESLRQALTLAEPAGYLRTFTDGGSRLTELLRLAAARGIAPAYAARLLAAMGEADRPAGAVTQAAAPTLVVQRLVEPLSERELEVLQMIAAGLSTQEIAETAFIAGGTVKRHIHNILGKLGAADRREAVKRARELGLVRG